MLRAIKDNERQNTFLPDGGAAEQRVHLQFECLWLRLVTYLGIGMHTLCTNMQGSTGKLHPKTRSRG